MSIHLQALNLHRTFRIGKRDIPVLRGLNLEIQRGETVFLCGASGAGKSTLLYTLAGLERPVSGKVMLDKNSLYDLSQNSLARLRNQQMGFVFQSYHLLPELTALENAALPALIGGNSARLRAEEILSQVGLAHRLHHLPAELSGGEQQRVAIARALVNDPAILFADEPTGNLDSVNGEIVLSLLLDLAREKQRTLVVVTHDPRLATRGDRRLEIADGIIQP